MCITLCLFIVVGKCVQRFRIKYKLVRKYYDNAAAAVGCYSSGAFYGLVNIIFISILVFSFFSVLIFFLFFFIVTFHLYSYSCGCDVDRFACSHISQHSQIFVRHKYSQTVYQFGWNKKFKSQFSTFDAFFTWKLNLTSNWLFSYSLQNRVVTRFHSYYYKCLSILSVIFYEMVGN